MASSDNPESTVVLRMLGDFDKFLSKPCAQSNPVELSDKISKRLNFDESTMNFGTSGSLMFDTGPRDKTPCASTSFSELNIEPPSRKRQREAELISSKTQVTRLGNRVSLLENTNKLAKLECEKQIDTIRLEHQLDKQKLEEMRSQLSRAIDKETEMLTELRSMKKTMKTTTAEYEEQINDLQKEKDDLKSDLEEQIAQLNEAVCMLESDLHRAQMDNNELQTNLQASEDRLKHHETNSVSLITYHLEMEKSGEELKDAQKRIHDLETELDKLNDAGKLVKILQGQLTDKDEFEKENKRLKERNALLSRRDENIMLLNEKLESSKQTIDRLENKVQAMQNCQLENEDLKHRLSAWESLSVIGEDVPRLPHNITKAIGELQQQNGLLLEKIGELTSSNNSLKKAKQALEEEIGKLKTNVNLSAITMKQNSDQIRHLQRKLLLVSKERDISRQLLDSYTNETTLVMTSRGNDGTQQFESIVEGYKRTVENLEVELNANREQLRKIGFQSGTEVEQEREKMSSEIKVLKDKVAMSESRISQLEEEKKTLELQIEYDKIKGDINPLKTRAVHLSSNPVAWARQQRASELEQVKKENVSLKQRLKVLEEVGEPIENLTITVEERLKEDPPAKVLEDLQKQLVTVEGKNKRLMEEFKKISSEFREVTYTLLGYNISLPCSGQFKLSNMYAESQDDYLLFAKAADTGELQLLETPFSSVIGDKIELFLHTHRSIPAFLSNLTLELFSSQTGIFSTSTCIIEPNSTASKCIDYHSEFADESVIVKPAYDAMNSHLQKLYQSKILCDLGIKLGDRLYSIHKIALTSHSEKYLSIFGDPATMISEIHLEGAAPETVEKVLKYLYTSAIDISEDSVSDIINICDQLDLKVLKEKCFNFLSNFDENNVCRFLRLSRHHKLEDLARKMHDFVAENIKCIRLDPHFGFLDIVDVCAILSSDTAHQRLKSEKHLLRIGMKWLKSCEPIDARQEFAAKVLKCIKLDKVRPKEIWKQVNGVPFILNDSECIAILREAFRHHACLAQNNGSNSFCRDRNQSDFVQSPLIDDKSQAIIVIGGIGDKKENSEARDDVLKFSIQSSKLIKLPSLLTRRSGHGAAFINGFLFVIGGYVHLTSLSIPKPTEIVDCYNDMIADKCWHCVAPMSVKRALFALTSTEDGYIYVFGGETEGFRPTEMCERYSMKYDQWTAIAPLSIGRIGASACRHNGVIYVIGGLIEETVLPLVESYHLGLERWFSRCPMPFSCCFGSLVQNADCLFFIGGINNDRATSKLKSTAAVLEYNILQDSWLERVHLPKPCHFSSAVVVGGKVYIIGGFSTETWEYSTDVVCFHFKSFHMDMFSLNSLPFGLMKAAAVGINL